MQNPADILSGYIPCDVDVPHKQRRYINALNEWRCSVVTGGKAEEGEEPCRCQHHTSSDYLSMVIATIGELASMRSRMQMCVECKYAQNASMCRMWVCIECKYCRMQVCVECKHAYNASVCRIQVCIHCIECKYVQNTSIVECKQAQNANVRF